MEVQLALIGVFGIVISTFGGIAIALISRNHRALMAIHVLVNSRLQAALEELAAVKDALAIRDKNE